ncbi:DUF4180 domain-containing protein [Deinococcus hopiensis]|uniref:DUF4180 domain-containing protein n=1 Tax=Deinococcus hopiensis KR-140 TaxID=695939 RepID=A0A1W1VEF3_9DEIO|nr:DUF4180 domain-containing protein [Deinococcus hopiensis]SMB91441.1 protein of unknown function [Deinococcus hopiensis KR-140]
MKSLPEIKTVRELGLSLRAAADVSEVLGAAYGLDGLLLTEPDLSPEFFRLSSGLAGEAFQKFTNYRLRVALVLPDFAAHGERFAELAREHARHPLIRFVHTEEEGRRWLEAGQ